MTSAARPSRKQARKAPWTQPAAGGAVVWGNEFPSRRYVRRYCLGHRKGMGMNGES